MKTLSDKIHKAYCEGETMLCIEDVKQFINDLKEELRNAMLTDDKDLFKIIDKLAGDKLI